MGLAEIIQLVNTGLSVIQMATQAGVAAAEIVKTIQQVKSWVDGSVTPTQADADALTAEEDRLLGIINDTSRDVAEE